MITAPKGAVGRIVLSADSIRLYANPIFNGFPLLLYSPLDSSAREIQVLCTHPAIPPNALFSTKLVHIRRDAESVYNCLSYTWGNTLKKRPILVNGRRFDATEYLVDALVHLREVEAILPNALLAGDQSAIMNYAE